MKNLHVILTGCIAIVVSGCNVTFLTPGFAGSGVSVSEDRDVTEFNKIDFSGAGNINVVCGKSPSLKITIDDNLLEFIETKVEGNVLTIRTTKSISSSATPTYDITTENLELLELSGSGKIDVADFEGKTIKFAISGSGKIHVVGVTDNVSFDISGSGSADMSGLTAKTARIAISGSGRVSVNASEKLDVHIAGSGQVDYIGSPEIHRQIAGSGKIREIKTQTKQDIPEDSDDIDDSENDSEEDDDPDDG